MITQTPQKRFQYGLMLCKSINALIENNAPADKINKLMEDAYKILFNVCSDIPEALPIVSLLAVDLHHHEEALALIGRSLELPLEDYVKTSLVRARQGVIEKQARRAAHAPCSGLEC